MKYYEIILLVLFAVIGLFIVYVGTKPIEPKDGSKKGPIDS